MLQTKIDTTDPTTGTELPVLAKVERADGALRGLLRKVGKGFEIEARWQFKQQGTPDPIVELTLVSLETPSTGVASITYPFPPSALDSEAAISRNLWEAIGLFIPLLSEVVDRAFESLQSEPVELAATAGD